MSTKADNKPADNSGRASEVDYQGMYQDYWSRPDRWGSHSFADPEAIADQLLLAFGQGTTLDVGCGMGLLVRTLLRRGIDAHGIDVAQAPIQHADAICPGRFRTGSILDLPFDDGAFDTVCSTDVLEHIAENDVSRALAELHRVCARGVFIRLAITPDRDRTWHLTVRDRQWWEQQFFDAGFERHPLCFRAVPYESIDSEGWQVTLVLAKATSDVGAHTRTATPEAELACALAARCQSIIRPNDRVLYAGDPSLARFIEIGSPAASVEAIDPNAPADWPAARDADSAEAIVSFAPIDTLHAARVLTPTGRLALCLAGAHADPTIESPLVLEQHAARDTESRTIRALPTSGPDRDEQATPDLIVLARTPLSKPITPYQERVYADAPERDDFHVASYERSHDNPWLLRWMISIGLRSTNDELVTSAAEHLLDGPSTARSGSARPGSADEGAAICVLGYRLLEPVDPDPAAIDRLLERIDAYDGRADDTPHAWRWRISNRYLAGLLELARGRLDRAEAAFVACSDMDPLRFSPLLASKTIDACYQAGVLALGRRDTDTARARFQAGLVQLERSCKADWLNLWGDASDPLPFGLPDLNSSVELAARCAFALNQLDHWHDRPGLAWQQASRRTLSDLRRWVQRLTDSRQHLDRERGRLRELALVRQDRIDELKAQLDQQRSRLERATEAVSLRDRAAIELRAHIEDRAQAIEHLTSQLQQRDRRIDELKRHAEERTAAIDRVQARLDERDRRINDLAEHASERTETIEQLKRKLSERDARIDDLASHARERTETIERLRDQLVRRDERIAELSEHASGRSQTIESLRESLEHSKTRIAELRAHAENRASAVEHAKDSLAKKGQRVVALEEHLASRRETIEQQQSKIEMLDARIAELTAQLGTSRDTIAWQGDQLRQRQTGSDMLRTQLATLQSDRDRLTRDLATLRTWSADLLRALRAREQAHARPAERQRGVQPK